MYLLLVAACNTSKYKPKLIFNKEITLSSLSILRYVWELGVFIVFISDGEYRI